MSLAFRSSGDAAAAPPVCRRRADEVGALNPAVGGSGGLTALPVGATARAVESGGVGAAAVATAGREARRGTRASADGGCVGVGGGGAPPPPHVALAGGDPAASEDECWCQGASAIAAAISAFIPSRDLCDLVCEGSDNAPALTTATVFEGREELTLLQMFLCQ